MGWTVVKGQTFQFRGPDFPVSLVQTFQFRGPKWTGVRGVVHLNKTKALCFWGVLDSCEGSCQYKGRKHIFVYSGLDSCKRPGTKVGISRLCGPESIVNCRRGTLRDRISDLDSCKRLVS